MDEDSRTRLCEGCQKISVDELVSDSGLTHNLLPADCRFCLLLLQALQNCGCGAEWKVQDVESTQQVWRAEMKHETHFISAQRWTNPVWGDKLWEGPVPDGLVKLWARPLQQARRLIEKLQTELESPVNTIIEERIEGITVCYGRTLVMNNKKWPKSLYVIEHGGNALQAAISPLGGTERYVKNLEHNKVHICSGSLVFTATPGSSITALLQYRIPAQQTDSKDNYDLVKSWVKNCTDYHQKCNHPSSVKARLPSRLVDVDGDGKKHNIKLVETFEGSASSATSASQSYIALSYCWGTTSSKGDFEAGEKYRTTFQNIERRKAGFSELDLPPTIRDAVTITRRLGFKYLWADALCILQGTDPKAAEDWASEATRMHQIYGNASLAIAAASAASAYDGIFDLFNYRSESAPVEINLWSSHPQIGQGSAFSKLLISSDSSDMPLYHRGWTLQERILSPRVVTYTCDQLLWECQTTTLTQRGLPMESLHTSRLPDNCSVGELQDRWQVLVTDYSARDLSFSTDKLPALSGLAQAFQAQLQDDEYLGGLWRSSLLDDLLWIHRPVDVGRRTVQGRPSEYRAPSWSWASVDGNVRWLYADANPQGPILGKSN
ncbi:HET-domain-containing protein [Mollisia scopiformis]|uniref:HET-domain-containing protein n=1 Tax=Mollisia scopiformis TaxID=149040 RepID=A0A194XUI9_MOLSC|nr:HET-domain-containing protein [Mollisia scopiformis]KUJ23878.1 HET-domain-containing protein [Mollisia scopiformis]